MLEYAIEYLEAELDSMKDEIKKDSKFKEEYEYRLPSIEMAIEILQKSERQTTAKPSKHPETKALHIADVSGMLPDQIKRHIDLAYLTGVFNVVGIDGLHKEIARLKEIGKNPHDFFS